MRRPARQARLTGSSARSRRSAVSAAAPDATRVEAAQARLGEVTQRGPVSEHEGVIAGRALRVPEPGHRVPRRIRDRSLVGKHEPSLAVDEAQTCQAIDREPQALHAREAGRPAVRLVAVHFSEKPCRIRTECALDFARASFRVGERPLRRQAGMDERPAERSVAMQHRPGREPGEELVAIRRIEHRLELRLAPLHCLRREGHREQVQVVVAEHDSDGATKCLHLAENGERGGPTIDEIPGEPEPVATRVELPAVRARRRTPRGSPAGRRSRSGPRQA